MPPTQVAAVNDIYDKSPYTDTHRREPIMPKSQNRFSTSNKIALIEERIIQIQTDINGLQQDLINNMMLLREIRWRENTGILTTAFDRLPPNQRRK
jgi:hypothetical protein